jgi:hypothetical protein
VPRLGDCVASSLRRSSRPRLPSRPAVDERLLGEPTFFPHDTEAVWTLAEDRSVYVVEDADGAGHSVVTFFVDDLDGYVAAIAARGLDSDEHQTLSNGVRKTLYRDPDGNELGFGGAPLATGT